MFTGAVDEIFRPVFRTVFGGRDSIRSIQGVRSRLVLLAPFTKTVMGVNAGFAGIEMVAVAGCAKVEILSMMGLSRKISDETSGGANQKEVSTWADKFTPMLIIEPSISDLRKT